MSDEKISELEQIMLDVAKLKKDAGAMMAFADRIEKAARRMLGNVEAPVAYYLDNPMLYFIQNSNTVDTDDNGAISIDDLTNLFNSFYKGQVWSKKQVRIEVSKLGFDSVRVGTKRGIMGLVRKDIHTDHTRH